jgi:hypothetical protein
MSKYEADSTRRKRVRVLEIDGAAEESAGSGGLNYLEFPDSCRQLDSHAKRLKDKKRLNRKISDKKKYSSASLEEQARLLIEAQQKRKETEEAWNNLGK